MCPLVIGSFGYNAEDVVYKWKQPKAVSIDKLGLAQFHLVDYKSYESFENVNRRTRDGMRNDSTATLNFNFERQTGFFLLQIYTPLTLIVFCSWVAFWLIKTEKGGEVPARTALGNFMDFPDFRNFENVMDFRGILNFIDFYKSLNIVAF